MPVVGLASSYCYIVSVVSVFLITARIVDACVVKIFSLKGLTMLLKFWRIAGVFILSVMIGGYSHGALHERDLDGLPGIDAVFNDATNTLWMFDADLMDGPSSYYTAGVWAESMSYGGLDDWRFPSVWEFNGLKNQFGIQATPGTAWGPFAGVQEYYFTIDLSPGVGGTWNTVHYSPAGHTFSWMDVQPPIHAWAVRSGDYGVPVAIPEPDNLALMLSGLAMVLALQWRRT
jgi:hypothetical protein